MANQPKGELQIKKAVELIDKLIKEIQEETTDDDIKWESGRAWSITKEYLNIK